MAESIRYILKNCQFTLIPIILFYICFSVSFPPSDFYIVIIFSMNK
ncbi:protein of unknown function [Xenorhabdus nematophila AN6/1]|nr:protein of unknown function [Xenorhabdus nematophila AN6/1]